MSLLLSALPALAVNETDQIPGENLPGVFVEPQENSAPVQLPGGPVSGVESPGGSFSLESPSGVIYNMERGLAYAQNDVSFTYREFNVRGDKGLVDYNTNEAILTGNLTVTVRGQVFKGRSLTFNIDTGRWTLTQIESTFPPEFFPPGTVLEPLYIRKGTLTGTDDTATGSDFRFSSCDRDHYYIESRRLDFYRDAQGEPDRIVLKKNKLYVLGKAVAPLPLFVIALQGGRARRSNLQPIVGQNSTDGFFVKTVYDLSANARRTDTVLIDALQKRGLGLGFTRELAKGAGLFYLYSLTGQNGGRQVDSRITRRWQITKDLTSNVNFQSTKDNEFSGPGNSVQNGDVQFTLNTERVNSDLSMRLARNSSSFGNFSSFGSSFQHRQDFGGGWSIDANSLYAGSRSTSSFGGGDSTSSTLDNTLQVQNRARLFDTFLRAELHDDLTGTTQINGAYALERLPEIGLSTDTERAGIPFLHSVVPGDFSLGFGTFNEPNTRQKLSRTMLDYRARQQTRRIAKIGAFESNILYAGRFNQSFYSDDTARYNYDFNVELQNSIGGLSTGVSYFKQRTQGYTPFQFDFLSPAESIDFIASYQPSEKFQLNLSTGRDLQNGYTRDIDSRLQWAPSKGFYASIGATYSPENRTFGDVISNFRFARNPEKILGGTLDLGLRYSPDLGRLSRVNATLDLFATRKTRIQALTGYNGVTREIDFNQIRVARDLHCFNLFATYDQSRKELRFDLALKAFPFVDTRLGIGQFGQGFDARIGDFSG
ncbi:MAG TPA: hypothetical protein VF681_12340 [Abditibacteriaceae bacterium]